jgi:hypothetical protein
MKKINILLLLILNFGLLSGQESNEDAIKLNELIIEFEKSIIEKDSVRFKKLFFTKEVPFVGRMSIDTEMSIKKDYPEFEGIAVSNSSQFIKEICESEKSQKEKFYNIKIESDGVIATINFDYSFHSGTKIIQWGNENWNLVYVDEKWLITDVIYSIRFPDIEKFPYY